MYIFNNLYYLLTLKSDLIYNICQNINTGWDAVNTEMIIINVWNWIQNTTSKMINP